MFFESTYGSCNVTVANNAWRLDGGSAWLAAVHVGSRIRKLVPALCEPAATCRLVAQALTVAPLLLARASWPSGEVDADIELEVFGEEVFDFAAWRAARSRS